MSHFSLQAETAFLFLLPKSPCLLSVGASGRKARAAGAVRPVQGVPLACPVPGWAWLTPGTDQLPRTAAAGCRRAGA